MNLENETRNTVATIEQEMLKDGVIKGCFLNAEECRRLRKLLQCVNTLVTVAHKEFIPNEIDTLVRRLRGGEDDEC